MAHDRERNIENYLRHHVIEMGLGCIKFIPDQANGMPDRLILLPEGRVVWVELKTEDGTLSEIQKFQHKKLRDLGQEVVVVWSKDEADKLLDRLEAEYL